MRLTTVAKDTYAVYARDFEGREFYIGTFTSKDLKVLDHSLNGTNDQGQIV